MNDGRNARSSQPGLAQTARRRARRRLTEGGQALAEFALVLPILVVLIFGMIEVAILIFSYQTITNAARDGARYGAIHPDDLAGIQEAVLSKAEWLDQSAVQVTPAHVGRIVHVTVNYAANPVTGPLIELLTGSPTISLQAKASAHTEEW